MWARRPRGQLKKCAEAQALRMAFPEAVGAAPTAEEMEGRSLTDFTEEVRSPPRDMGKAEEVPRETYPDAGFTQNLPTWRELITSGKKTAEQVIATVEKKAPLTEQQKAAIRGTPASTEAAPWDATDAAATTSTTDQGSAS
jgi:hypothetical protein